MSVHYLPHQPTSFIGREAEIAQIIARLSAPNCRLLTLVGLGGSGKTRLAIETAERQADSFPDGVWFVPLQPLQYSTQIVAAILDVLPIQVSSEPHTQLLNFLRDKHLLLVLDNFEHLLESVELVSEILVSAPHIKILVTSREVLNLQEEWVQSIEGMMYSQAQSIHPVEQYDAVRLFGERAGQVRHTFSLDQELEFVLHICRLVDGLPLALELAAGWTRAMSCQAIAAELEQGNRILTSDRRNIPARHSSIQNVLEHTWQRLANDEQAVFRRLSVFRGGFTREAAEQVAGASLMILAHLVDKSLVIRNADDRYGLHELLRQYAAEQLEIAGESQRIHDAHSEYFLDFVTQRTGVIYGPNLITHLDEVERDFDNIRAAWYRAVANRNAGAISRAVECLTWFCDRRGRILEHEELYILAQKQFAPSEGEPPPFVWGQLMVRRASLMRYAVFDYEEKLSFTLLKAGLEVAHSHENPFEIAFAAYRWGDYLMRQGNLDAITPLEQGLALFQEIENEFYTSECWFWIACHFYNLDDLEQFLYYMDMAVCLKFRLGDKNGLAWGLIFKGTMYHQYGYPFESEAATQRALQLFEEIRSPAGLALAFRFLTNWKFQQGDFEEARRFADRAFYYAVNTSSFDGKASVIQSLIRMDCLVMEEYSQAIQFWHENKTDFTDPLDPLPLIALCGLEQFDVAREKLTELLKHFGVGSHFAYVPDFLTIAAIILANQGETDYAAELFGLVFAQHVAYVGWVHRWPLVTRLLALLKSTLGDAVYEAALERGKRRDALTTAAELRVRFEAELQADRSKAHPTSVDTLTDRELDVLRLLAKGHSNREIAETLVLAVGTIKGYVHIICQKLHAQNRTQAVAHARQQGLLP